MERDIEVDAIIEEDIDDEDVGINSFSLDIKYLISDLSIPKVNE